MKKKLLFPVLATVLVLLAIGTTCLAASSTDIVSSIKSQNTLKYQGADGEVALYGSDIMLLAGKLSSIPDRPFDPDIYTHIHSWEYIDINDSTHTKHCAVCGSENDLINPHTASQKEPCDVTYGGNTYNLNKCTCECSYQWIEEYGHHLVYESVDDTEHSVSCALDGTKYCSGLRSYTDEHYMDDILPNDDNIHHTLRCSACGYEKEEACDFTDHSEINEDGTEITWYCLCGNSTTEPYTDSSGDPDTTPDDSNPDDATENTDETPSQTPDVASYISNNDGTHKVMSGTEIISSAEPCSLIADPESYNDVTGKATYTCELCSYSVEDDYEPVTGE